MARRMCGISLNDGNAAGIISNEQLRTKLGIESINEVMC